MIETRFLLVVAGFIILALASRQIGLLFARIRLPLISGFLFAGILFGPFVLGFIERGDLDNLHFIDQISLAFIAFAAGSELYLKELRNRLRSIAWVSAGNTLVVPILGTLSLLALSSLIPFMRDLAPSVRIAIALLGGAILVARSPSSAIAIVNELRAKGPFTQTVIGVTMLTDVIVIVLFAINLEVADALLLSLPLNLGFLGLLLFELLLSLGLGILVGLLLNTILRWRVDGRVKAALMLAIGYGVFLLTGFLREYSHAFLPFELLLEPLLICMIGSFIITNRSSYRAEYLRFIEQLAPPIYVIFFTLTGASLALDTLATTWHIALALFAVRMLGIFIGSSAGGRIAGDPPLHNRLSWLTYVTQAGVGLGLAKEVAAEFPGWGADFATTIIAVVVVSQIIGPPLFKWAMFRVGEAHPRHATPEFDGVRDAIIFGVDGQSVALARQLSTHGWNVRAACLDSTLLNGTAALNLDIRVVDTFSVETLRQLGADGADAMVMMLSDAENYRICELAYEHFGTETLVVLLNDRENLARFHALGALVVDPGTVMVSMLDHFVRSPSATTLLLGMATGQDVVEIEVRNRNLHGRTLRELRLPLDTLVLAINRDGEALIPHGYTRLNLGDHITFVGSTTSLSELTLRFDDQSQPAEVEPAD